MCERACVVLARTSGIADSSSFSREAGAAVQVGLRRVESSLTSASSKASSLVCLLPMPMPALADISAAPPRVQVMSAFAPPAPKSSRGKMGIK